MNDFKAIVYAGQNNRCPETDEQGNKCIRPLGHEITGRTKIAKRHHFVDTRQRRS